jgi:hypothetical protein
MRCGVVASCFQTPSNIQPHQQLHDTECGWLCRDGKPVPSLLSGINEINKRRGCSSQTRQLGVCRLDSSASTGTPLCQIHGQNMPDLCFGVNCGNGVLWIAAECKCKVKSPAVDRLRGDLRNKQLGNYDAVLILLPKTIVEHNTRKQNEIKRMLEQDLSKRLGKMVVVTYCYDSHRS